MAISYPRKQTVIIFMLCMVAVLGAAYYNSSAQETSAATPPGAISVGSDAASADTASSVPEITVSSDWKQQFMGTSSVESAAQNASSDQPLTLTDQFGRNIFTQYLQLEQAGSISDPDTVDNTVSGIVDNGLSTEQPRIYASTDIHAISANDKISLAQWSAVVSADLDLYTYSQSEATIAQDYVSQNDPTILKGIDPIIVSYKKMIASLTAVPTPSSIAPDSLDLLNSLSDLEFAAQSFSSIAADPLKGMLGLSAYSNGVQQLLAALKETSDALQAQGIIFEINPKLLSVLLGTPQQP